MLHFGKEHPPGVQGEPPRLDETPLQQQRRQRLLLLLANLLEHLMPHHGTGVEPDVHEPAVIGDQGIILGGDHLDGNDPVGIDITHGDSSFSCCNCQNSLHLSFVIFQPLSQAS